jgi:hypothetical protein
MSPVQAGGSRQPVCSSSARYAEAGACGGVERGGRGPADFGRRLITPKAGAREFIRDRVPGRGVEACVVPARIEAVRA